MSFFSRDGSYSIQDDTERGSEVADGVVVERRSVLWLSAATIASFVGGAGSARSQDPAPAASRTEASGLSFEQFLEQIYPLSRRLVDSDGEDEEAYVMTVAAALSRLSDPNAPLKQTMRAFVNDNRKPGERFPLVAMSLRLKPGRGFEHHDHWNYNGVILGVEGEVRIRNFDIQGTAPPLDSTETFHIRETRDDLILPGRFSTLGRNRENIHDLVAGPAGARVLDVFTFFGEDATSRFLDVETKPRDIEARIYDATWRPRRSRSR